MPRGAVLAWYDLPNMGLAKATRRGLARLLQSVAPGCTLARKARWESFCEDSIRFYRQGDFQSLEQTLGQAVRFLEESPGQDPDLVHRWNRLGELYENLMGRFIEAEAMYQRAIAAGESWRGPEDPDLVAPLNNLALLYHHNRRYQEAEFLLLRLMPLVEKRWGPHHPEMATCLENYAALLRKTHREQAAEEVQARAKKLRKAWEASGK